MLETYNYQMYGNRKNGGGSVWCHLRIYPFIYNKFIAELQHVKPCTTTNIGNLIRQTTDGNQANKSPCQIGHKEYKSER